MIPKPSIISNLVFGAALSLAGTLAAQTYPSLEVTGALAELKGSTSDVPGGGAAANFVSSFTVGSFAAFRLSDAGGAVADLRVSYAGSETGTLPGLMVARTTNSQTLTDAGTISILLQFSTATRSEATFTFDTFEPDGTFSVAKAIRIQFTTFDLDYDQFVSTPTGDIQTAFNYSYDVLGLPAPSDVTISTSGGETIASAGAVDAIFNDPTNAASFMGNEISSRSFSMGKNGSGNALFMFEFRSPSAILPVPEPSAAALALLAGLGVLRRRRA